MIKNQDDHKQIEQAAKLTKSSGKYKRKSGNNHIAIPALLHGIRHYMATLIH